jgi:hypothetical protein
MLLQGWNKWNAKSSLRRVVFGKKMPTGWQGVGWTGKPIHKPTTEKEIRVVAGFVEGGSRRRGLLDRWRAI